MKFRFLGNYTNGHDKIDAGGVMFYDREPSEVMDEGLIARLKRNPEFDQVAAKVDPEAVPPAVKPRKYTRKAKK